MPETINHICYGLSYAYKPIHLYYEKYCENLVTEMVTKELTGRCHIQTGTLDKLMHVTGKIGEEEIRFSLHVRLLGLTLPTVAAE